MKKRAILIVTLLSAVALASGGCKKKNADQAPTSKTAEGSAAIAGSAAAAPTPAAASASLPTPTTGGNVLAIAKQAGTFNTFLKAVDAAGIADNLNGPGPFTIFAPTDDAFAKLAPKDLDALLADKAKLTQVLQYHIVATSVSSKDLGTAKTETSIEGADLAIDTSSGVKVGGATVVKPDLVASNGIIHGIDTVLIPPAK